MKKKIAVIGPVYPYKSGIAHYTGLLVAALKERYTVYTISYKMQYPRILFHGEQKDYENDGFKVDDAEFLINTVNPFNIDACARYINSLDVDLVLIEWWHPYFSPCYQILMKRLRSKILFLCHNVFPHERFPMDRALTRAVLKKGDYFILHSQKEAADLKSIVADAKYAINMHPTYSAYKMSDHSADEGDTSSKLRMLFFGFVRPYKGLDVLLRAMKSLPDDVVLNIVGDFGDSRGEYDALIEEGDLANRVMIREGFVPDKEVEKYFNDCDVVVLPYREATQSGIAQIALGLEKPVIVTDAGGLPEVVIDGVTGVLCKAGDEESLAHAVQRFMELRGKIDFAKNIREDSERFSWPHMVNTISTLCSSELEED
ncbi:MAG: glycosyltransferase [Lachnospiraceae bacterium]|nr:glycosyltransferase [Lachnospiraceae bacterium]